MALVHERLDVRAHVSFLETSAACVGECGSAIRVLGPADLFPRAGKAALIEPALGVRIPRREGVGFVCVLLPPPPPPRMGKSPPSCPCPRPIAPYGHLVLRRLVEDLLLLPPSGFSRLRIRFREPPHAERKKRTGGSVSRPPPFFTPRALSSACLLLLLLRP